jgi:hypothetical protein
VDSQTSSEEEIEAKVGEEEEESDGEFCDRTKAPVPPSGRYWPQTKRFGHSFAQVGSTGHKQSGVDRHSFARN